MAGDEAKEYGIIDHVIVNREDLDHLENTEA
jgi:ATP-dependent protease ClpP protease subunit